MTALLLGVPFGFTIAWCGMNDPDVIRRMMLLQSFYLYEVFALAVAVGLAGSLLLPRLARRAVVTGEALIWERPRPQRRHVVGSIIFGCGWALASSCPGPIATQLAGGLWWSGFTIAGIAAGIGIFLRRQDHLRVSRPVSAPQLAPVTEGASTGATASS